MLDDGDDRLLEFLRQIPGGLEVDDVVVGEFLALQLAGVGHADAGAVGVHGGFLVRVLSVAEVEGFLERGSQSLRERSGAGLRSVGADAFQR